MNPEQAFLQNTPQAEKEPEDALDLYEKTSDLIEQLPETPKRTNMEKQLEEYYERKDSAKIKDLIKTVEEMQAKIELLKEDMFPETIEDVYYSGCLSKEELEETKKNQYEFIKELLKNKENYLGEGRTAKGYIDRRYPKDCYKIIYNPKEYSGSNKVRKEMKLMEKIADLEISGCRIPKPRFCIMTKKAHAICMETVPGFTLEQIMEGSTEAPRDVDWKDFFDSLRDFVKKMHERGIYHRDIVERNIMIDLETKKPRLIDFGESRDISDSNYEDSTIEMIDNSEDIRKNFLDFIGKKHLT